MTDENTRAAIRDAFREGTLRVRAVNPDTGEVGLHPVSDVMRHHTGDRASVTCTTADGRSVTTTCDHSLFHVIGGGKGLAPVRADALAGKVIHRVLADGTTDTFTVPEVVPVDFGEAVRVFGREVDLDTPAVCVGSDATVAAIVFPTL